MRIVVIATDKSGASIHCGMQANGRAQGRSRRLIIASRIVGLGGGFEPDFANADHATLRSVVAADADEGY